MKSYKEFDKEYIGTSDSASLILCGCPYDCKIEDMEKESLKYLNFGEDGSYYAYIIKENDVEIGNHYKKVVSFKNWLKIYDDFELAKCFRINGRIDIYRAGEFGCIIHLVNDWI